MIAAFSASLSGLMAQTKRLAVSANNVANMTTRGWRKGGPAQQPGGFIPKRTLDVTTAGGGVRAEVRPVTPPSVEIFSPGRPDADAEGVVALANVSLAEELVTQIQAQRAYEANAQVIRTQNGMTDSLLDIKS